MHRFGVTIIFIALIAITVNIGGVSEGAPSVVIEAGTFHPPGTGDVAGLEHFKSLVEGRSGGEIMVNVSFGETLGSELDTVEQARLGTLHVVTDGLGTMGRYGKPFSTWTVPYAYPDFETLQASVAGPIGQAISSMMEKDGILFGGLIPMGYRNMTANIAATDPAMIKGIKLRLPNNRTWITVWKQFGVVPTPVPAPEMYLALQTGLVEAQENPYTTIHVRKLWEVQDYVIETGHIVDFHIIVLNKPFIDGLKPEHREIVMTAIDETVVWQTEYVKSLQEKYKQEAIDGGMKIIEPDKEAYRKIAMSSWAELAKDWEPWVYDQMIKETSK